MLLLCEIIWWLLWLGLRLQRIRIRLYFDISWRVQFVSLAQRALLHCCSLFRKLIKWLFTRNSRWRIWHSLSFFFSVLLARRNKALHELTIIELYFFHADHPRLHLCKVRDEFFWHGEVFSVGAICWNFDHLRQLTFICAVALKHMTFIKSYICFLLLYFASSKRRPRARRAIWLAC